MPFLNLDQIKIPEGDYVDATRRFHEELRRKSELEAEIQRKGADVARCKQRVARLQRSLAAVKEEYAKRAGCSGGSRVHRVPTPARASGLRAAPSAPRVRKPDHPRAPTQDPDACSCRVPPPERAPSVEVALRRRRRQLARVLAENSELKQRIAALDAVLEAYRAIIPRYERRIAARRG